MLPIPSVAGEDTPRSAREPIRIARRSEICREPTVAFPGRNSGSFKLRVTKRECDFRQLARRAPSLRPNPKPNFEPVGWLQRIYTHRIDQVNRVKSHVLNLVDNILRHREFSDANVNNYFRDLFLVYFKNRPVPVHKIYHDRLRRHPRVLSSVRNGRSEN